MNDTNIIERTAVENQRIAKDEDELAIKTKELANVEFKRAKARESLISQEIILAKIKREVL